MRKVISQQMSFGDGFIDASLYELDEELKKVDELLGDAKLLKPFEEVFDESMGRPGTAVGIYLRMMYLKFRWGLSYEEVEAEVRERLPWRYFCHLSLMDSVPDATTLIKLNQRFGEERITDLNSSWSVIWSSNERSNRAGFASTRRLWKPISLIPPTSASSIKRCARLAVQRDRWGKRLSAMCVPLRGPWPAGEPVLRPSPKSVKPKARRFSGR